MAAYQIGETLWWVAPGYVGIGFNYFKPGPMAVYAGRVVSFDETQVCLLSEGGGLVFRQPTELTRDLAQAEKWRDAPQNQEV